MRHKHIGVVGASLIATLGLLSGLAYYFSQANCLVGTFQCHNSTICIPQNNWCNGIRDCPLGDDEFENCNDIECRNYSTDLGDFEDCDVLGTPAGCFYNKCGVTCENYTDVPQDLSSNVTIISLIQSSLTRLSRDALSRYSEIRILYLVENHISELEKEAFLHQSELLSLMLDGNRINEIQPGHLTGLNKLEVLSLNENEIAIADFSDLENSTDISSIMLTNNMLTTATLKLPWLPTLEKIALDGNRFESITEDLLAGCPGLKSLNMAHNSVSYVDERAFRNLRQLLALNLAYNKLVTLPADVFQPVNNLSKLLIGYNPVAELPTTLFNPLSNLRSLGAQDINMNNMKKEAFDMSPNLDFIYFKKFHYCVAYASKVHECKPVSDGMSSPSHLLDKPLLRAAVWGISFITCVSNGLVLWGRFTAKDENRVLSIIIKNLAVSDMLMGIYLFIIAIKDSRFRDNYKEEANAWMSSWSCALLGALAMTSSEVSVLILLFMSVERFILISAPLKCHRAMTCQNARLSMLVIWIIGLIFAIMPAIIWRSNTKFYGVNGMCFPLHIEDPYLIGWEYSAFIFLGINLAGLMIIGYVYTGMFTSIWRTRHATTLSVGDSEFALRFFLIVLTDAACWVPIIALKIFAMMKYPVSQELCSWIVIFILPVNSAINPLLYTFTTPKFRERLSEFWCGQAITDVSKKHSGQDSQESATTVTNKNAILSLPIWTNCDDDRKKALPPFH